MSEPVVAPEVAAAVVAGALVPERVATEAGKIESVSVDGSPGPAGESDPESAEPWTRTSALVEPVTTGTAPRERVAAEPDAESSTTGTAAAPAAAAPALVELVAGGATGMPVAGPVDIAQVGQRLKELFPALFRGQQRPLKLRIQLDIQQRSPGVFTKQALAAFFRRYTSGTGYLIAITKASHRFDLDGQPAGEIADEHRRLAQDELERRRGNREQREELLEQQRRNRATLLRDFERTTLTRANFCVLKGVEEGELDGLLELAREESRAFVPPPRRPVPDATNERRGVLGNRNAPRRR